MNIKAYLERIQYKGSLHSTIEILQNLQLCHLLSIPFENLSIHAKEPIQLQEKALFDKIVTRRRGGFCYELNGLFAALLRQLGFNVTLLSASVAKADGGYGPDFAHLTLMVSLKDNWLVDVGFGDSFRQPLLIDKRDVQTQGAQSYRIGDNGDHLILMERDGGDWKAQYRFTLQPHVMAHFFKICLYHQTSPESTFTQRRICSLLRSDGRVTLSDMRLIETTNGGRHERVLENVNEYEKILKEKFGITMTA